MILYKTFYKKIRFWVRTLFFLFFTPKASCFLYYSIKIDQIKEVNVTVAVFCVKYEKTNMIFFWFPVVDKIWNYCIIFQNKSEKLTFK